MKDPIKISDAEWEVMEAVWPHASITAAEIIAQLSPKRSWSEATVKTMLNRLVKKGALKHRSEGRRYRYSAKVSREQAVHQQTDRFLDRVCQGDASPLLSFFVKKQKLNDDELDALRRLLDEQEGGDTHG